VVSNTASETLKKLLEYLGHPIPAWPHIEDEAIGFKGTAAATKGLIFFEYRYSTARLSQLTRCAQSGKAPSDNGNSFVHDTIDLIHRTRIGLFCSTFSKMS
jgi:hypothetical protein